MPAIKVVDTLTTSFDLHETLFVRGQKNVGYIPLHQYHADRSCVSSSSLKEILRSPAHYRAYLSGEERKTTPALFFGQAVHDMLLEPKPFQRDYVVTPFPDRRLKESREFELAHANKKILNQEQAEHLRGISVAVSEHSFARKLLAQGGKELTHIWQDKETGIWVKIRPDCLSLSEGICLDIKKTQDASPHSFARSCVDYNYDLQAALYLEGLREIYHRDFDFVFLAVEEKKPNACAIYAAPADMLERGNRRFRAGLQKIKECTDSNLWPSYQPCGGCEVLEWPSWAK